MAQGGRIDYTIGFNVDKSGLQNIQKELAKINQMSAKEVQSINPSLKMNEAMSVLKKAQVAAYDVQKAMNEAFNPTLGITNLEKLQSSLKRLDLAEVQRRFAAIGPTGQKAFLDISKSALTTSVQLKQTSKLVDKIGETLINTVKWQFSSSIVNRFTGAVQQAVGYVQHLDSSLNDIRIVTGKSADEMEKFAGQANKAAQSLGKSTTDYTEAALIYYQQGLSDEEVAARAETTLKTANVTGQSTAAVSEELTAVWNGYRVSTEETEAAIDKLAAVAATTASDLQELSTGMSKVASAANAMGVDMDQLNAQIATIISVTRQAPESVGTALKTIYARMGDLKLGETDEDGLGLGDVSGTLEKVGISVLDVNGDLREMGDVMEDVAAKWNTWTSAQQVAIAEVMAGKRQYNNLIALFENWDMYSKALDTSKNSLGTLQQQQDIYMESTEAHVQMLKTEWEDLYDSIIDEDAIKGVSDALRGVLNLVTNLVDGLGGGTTLLTGLFALIGNKFGKQIAQALTPFIQNIKAAKQNAAQLQTLLDNIETSRKNGDFGFEAAKAMRENQEEMSKYWHLMSAEEFNATQENIREIGEWTQKKEEIKQAEEQLKSYIATFGNQTLNKAIGNKSFFTGNEEGKEVVGDSTRNQLIERIENNQKKFENSVKGMKKAKEEYDKIFETKPSSSKNAEENRINKLDNAINHLKSNLKSYETELRKIKHAAPDLVNEEEIQKAEKAIDVIKNKIKQFNKEGKVTPDFSKEFAQEFEVLDQVIGKTESKYKVFLQVLKETGSYEQAIEALKKYEDALNKDIYSLQNKIEAVSKILGGISQFAFGLQSLSNLGNIFSNDDLDAGEKLLQLITALGIGLPALTGGIKGVSKGLVTLMELLIPTEKLIQKENITETGSIFTKRVLIPLIGEEAAATTSLATAATAALGALTALAAVYAVIKISSAIYQKSLERTAEAARQAADADREQLDALKEQKDHIDEIASKYDELTQSIKDQTTTEQDAREEIYNLCKAYGLQSLAVEALTGDYAKLEESIKKAQLAQAEEELKKTQSAITTEGEAIKTELKAKGLGEAGDDFLTQAALDPQKIYEKLEKDNGAYAEKIRKALAEEKDNLSQYAEYIEQERALQVEISANSIINTSEIASEAEFEKQRDELLNNEELQKSFTVGGILDEEALHKAVDQYLAGIDEIKQYAQQADIADVLMEDTSVHYSRDELQKQLAKREQYEIDFLVNNKELAAAYEDLDQFFKDVHDDIEYANSSENRINVEVVLTSAFEEGKFSEDEIKKLYGDTNFEVATGVSQEEFAKLTFQKQTELAQQYYHTLIEEEEKYQAFVAKGLTENEENTKNKIEADAKQLEALEEEIGISLDQITEEEVEKQVGDLVSTVQEELNKGFVGAGLGPDAIVDIDTATGAIEEFNEKGIEGLKDMKAEYQDFITILISSGYTEEQIKSLGNISKGYQTLKKEFGKTGKEAKDLTNQYEGLIKKENQLSKETKKLDKSVQAGIDFAQAKEDLKNINSQIDELQSNYKSLSSIMEEYNSTQTLSMDNLQTILDMDTKYLSALQIEDGQMSLNEEVLKQMALARLDEAEAEAYEQAMAELNNTEMRASYEASQIAQNSLAALGNSATEAAAAARAGVDDWNAYWEAATHGLSASDSYAKAVGDSLRTKLQAIDSVRQQILSGGLGSSFGGGSGSGGGGGSEKDPEHEEYLEREADIYRTINEELEQIESTLGRIQNINDHEWGIDAQKTLEQENKLLDQQLEKLQEKKKLQERDLSTRRKQLEDVGVNFSADGSAMTNAESTLDAMYAHYNSMVDMYNAMSAAEQETYKANLEAEKDRIDKVEQKIDDYESTFSDYQSTLDSLIDVHYQQIENTVKQFNNMVDVHLELDEAKEEWNDFWFDVVQDIEDTDFTKQIEKSVKKLEVLIGTTLSNTDSEVSILTNHLLETVSEVQDQIASANRGGEASIFGDDSALSKETLENYRDQLMEALTSAKEELDNISDSYLDMLDSAQDKIDKQVKAWESIGEHLEHNVSLIKLISGDKSYEALDKIYQQQYQNNLQLLTTQRTSMEYWQNMIDKYANLLQTTEEGSKEWKTYSEAYEKASMNYKEAVSNLDKTIEDALNKLEEWKKSQLDAINETFDRTLSSNLGLDQLEKEWNVINDSASRYFDNVERALEMEGLEDAFDKVIENTKEASRAQQELNQMRDEEIARLNQKTKLSQFDIDEVKARLEIRKQELALEDAQKNKTNLRLRRDSQGNYNYQYTGDDSQIEEASEGLLSAKKEWYELVKNRNIDLAKAVLENRKNLQSELAALDDMYFENDDARRAKQIEIINKYAEREKDIMGDAESAKQIFFDGTAKFFADVENNTVLPQWNTTIEGMIDAWSGGGEDSFTNAVKRGIEEIEKVQDEFNIRTEEILTKAGVNYIKLKETGIDPTIDSLNELTESNEELESALEEVNDQLIEQESYLRDCEQAYNSLKDAAVNAIAQANSALNALAQTAIQTIQQVQAAIAAAQQAQAIASSMRSYSPSSSGGGGGNGSSGGYTTKNKIRNSDGTINNTNSRYHISKEANGRYSIYDTKYDKYVDKDLKYINPGGAGSKYNVGVGGGYGSGAGSRYYAGYAQYGVNLTDDDIRRILAAYDTGGYTGSWGSDGKIAMLHEKELVLNKKDTENMLDAVNLLRTFSVSEIADSIIGAAKTSASILAGVTSKASQAVAGVSNNQTNNYRDMTINADFSGVKSADAIYQALTELSNYGMQEAYSNSPLANKSY